MIKIKKYNLNENLRPGDLRGTIDGLIEIDRYKSKLGSDSNTIVVAFKAHSQDAANDLGAYLEWSLENIQDVEVSDASDKDGKFHVYIELQRLPGVCDKIVKIVDDIENATEKQDWKFVGMDGHRNELNIGSLSSKVVQDPKLYELPIDSRDWYLRMKNLTQY